MSTLHFQPFITPTNIDDIKVPKIILESQNIPLPKPVLHKDDTLYIEQDKNFKGFDEIIAKLKDNYERISVKKSTSGKKSYSLEELKDFAKTLGIKSNVKKEVLVEKLRDYIRNFHS